MSVDYSNLCSVILRQIFGDIVQQVGDCLFEAQSRCLANIVKTTKLSRKEVVNALAVLIKFQLVTFSPSERNPHLAEYELKRDEILYILRYPRYMHTILGKYGETGTTIAEELLHSGTQSATALLVKCITSPDNTEKIKSYRDVLCTMISDNYIIKIPMVVASEETEAEVVPKLKIEEYELFTPPDIDLALIEQIQNGTAKVEQAKDAHIQWQVNFSRLHQDFRDAIMVEAMEKKLGASAAECFKYILKQMYERTNPWFKESSNPFTFGEVRQLVEKKSNNLELMKHLDQYMSIIADDSLKFIRRTGDMGGGQFVVDMNHAFEELALACIENIITERFGSKASRIFRVIRMKKYIEQEDIQKEAMIPAKEAKLLAYSLFQEQFIQIKTLRKAGGGGAGPAKAFYLFHMNTKQIVKMLLDICYKALFNDITRANFEKSENKRLIDKSQKLDSIVASMKERGESEDYINEIMETLTPPEREILEKVKSRLRKLSESELALDDTIFLLQMYMYHTSQPGVVKNL